MFKTFKYFTFACSFIAVTGGTEQVEPLLKRVQASFESLPPPVSPLKWDCNTGWDAGSSTHEFENQNPLEYIKQSRLAFESNREGIFSEEEYTCFSQVRVGAIFTFLISCLCVCELNINYYIANTDLFETR